MSKFSKLGRREKNKWQRELEQIFEDEYITKRARELDEEQDWIEQEHLAEIREWDDFGSYYDDFYEWNDFDYEEWDRYETCYDDLDYIDKIDDWHLDSRTYADAFSPGCHVQNGKDVYLVLTTNQFANLRTGEVVRWLDHAELIWGS